MHSLCPFGTPNFSVPNQQSPRSSQGVLKCCGDLSWSKRPPAVRWRRWIGWGEIRVAVSLCWFQVLEPSNTLQKGLSWSGGCPWSWAQHSRAALGRMLSACAWWAPVPTLLGAEPAGRCQSALPLCNVNTLRGGARPCVCHLFTSVLTHDRQSVFGKWIYVSTSQSSRKSGIEIILVQTKLEI